MGAAIVEGYCRQNNNTQVLTYSPTGVSAKLLADKINGKAVSTLKEVCDAKTIIIACKPQQLGDLATNLKNEKIDLSQKHIISILAATPINTLKLKLGASKITRVMPNTPSMIGEGVSLLLHSPSVEHNGKDFVETFFNACGQTINLPNEEIFDKVTTVSGSGPAYVYLFAQAMYEKLISWGTNEQDARVITDQLFVGSSMLMNNKNDKPLSELIANVTSKKGVTIEAVNYFKEQGISQMTSEALECAYSRSNEILKELDT